jgi:hypothetical protein
MLLYEYQASWRLIARPFRLLGLAFVAIAPTGCFLVRLPDSATLPAVEPVTVADGVTVQALLGAGAPSLTDSTWAVYKADDDSLLFRIEFGSSGEVTRIFDSFVFAREWLGSEVIPDGQARPTDFPGGRYVSGAYAAEQGGSVGVLGILHGLLLSTHLGTATLGFSGPVEGDRIDGTMIRTVMILAETPPAMPSLGPTPCENVEPATVRPPRLEAASDPICGPRNHRPGWINARAVPRLGCGERRCTRP